MSHHLIANPTFLLTASGFIAVAFIVATVIQATRNPLNRLPGPFISRFSELRLKYAVLTGQRAVYVHSLHQKYGPIVRVSPREVELADLAAVRKLYKIGAPFPKSTWYRSFTGDLPVANMFDSLDSHHHAATRRLAANSFSEQWIKRMEPHIVRNVQLAVSRMEEDSKKQGYFDTHKWFTFMATDVIGEASFGESFRMLETGKKDIYISDLENAGKFGALRSEFPVSMKLISLLPFGPARHIERSISRFSNYSQQSIDRYWRQWRADPDNVKPTLLDKEYAAFNSGKLETLQMQRDASGYIVAGTDTTAMTAMYAVHYLSQHPALEKALIEAVVALPANAGDEALRQIPLLQGVINETLRLRSPVAVGLPRAVSAAGGAEFNGYYLPQNTTINVQAWTMHRDPSIWGNPEIFDPSRWENPTKDMKDAFLPFGGGSRVCIGMHFAQLELRHALAAFYRTFTQGVKISSAEGFSHADMDPRTYFLISPVGHRCLMQRK